MSLFHNHLNEKLKTEFPFWQAPLPFQLLNASFAGKLSAAGALGMIYISPSCTVQELQAMIRDYQEFHPQPSFCFTHPLPQLPQLVVQDSTSDPITGDHSPIPEAQQPAHFLDLFDVVCNANPRAIGFANGIPDGETIRFINKQSIHTFAICHSVVEALAASSLDVSIIVLQGLEAGGERFQFSNQLNEVHQPALSLLQQVRALVKQPIVLWGDFTHGADIVAAMVSGAQGVMLDRPFVQCQESELSDGQYAQLANTTEKDSTLRHDLTFRMLRTLPFNFSYAQNNLPDPLLRAYRTHLFFAQHPEARPLCVALSACDQLPKNIPDLLSALTEQMQSLIS